MSVLCLKSTAKEINPLRPLYLVCPIYVYRGMFANSQGLTLDENELLPMLAQEAGKFILLLYKGWVQFDSSELLSVTSSIAWHHDTEKQCHLSNNPHPIHKIARYTTLFFISQAVESLRVPRDVQQRAAFRSVLQKPGWFAAQTLRFPLGLRYLGTIRTPLQQAGGIPPSNGDAPSPISVFVTF